MSDENTNIASNLLVWHQQHGRKNLPWQGTIDPYLIWLSEIMLQQTQVKTVIPYFEKFIAHFPNVSDLAHASIDEVLALWSGLGYYARGRNLHKAAVIIEKTHGGQFPSEFEKILALPGIGRSTAGAILAFSDNKPYAILDGNVKRVLCRFYAVEGYPGEKRIENQLWELAQISTPRSNVRVYTQAIMDLGAIVCTRSHPNCAQCPLMSDCLAYKEGLQELLPTRKTKKALITKKISMLLILNNKNEIFLEKRPPSGIWGGLWSLPECEENMPSEQLIASNLGIEVKYDSSLKTYKHTFSHFHLQITPHLFRLEKLISAKEKDQNFAQITRIEQFGLPKPVKYLISQLELNE